MTDIEHRTLGLGNLTWQGFAAVGQEVAELWGLEEPALSQGGGGGIPLGFIRKTTPHAHTGFSLQLTKLGFSSVSTSSC